MTAGERSATDYSLTEKVQEIIHFVYEREACCVCRSRAQVPSQTAVYQGVHSE